MKRALSLILPAIALLSLSFPAFADTEDLDSDSDYLSYDVSGDSGPVDVIVLDTPELSVRLSEPVQLSEPLVSVTYNAAPPSEPDTSDSLTAALVAVLGEYEPRMKTVSITAVDGTVTEYTEPVEGLAGMDFQWIASAVLFTVVLYCLLRIVGGIFKWS